MYTKFDAYSPYTGAISDFLNQILMPTLSAVMYTLIQLPNKSLSHELSRIFGEC